MFDKAQYDREYFKQYTRRKFLLFNLNNPADLELLDWLDRQDNYNRYIKSLIRRDMDDHKQTQ